MLARIVQGLAVAKLALSNTKDIPTDTSPQSLYSGGYFSSFVCLLEEFDLGHNALVYGQLELGH